MWKIELEIEGLNIYKFEYETIFFVVINFPDCFGKTIREIVSSSVLNFRKVVSKIFQLVRTVNIR